jgi:hypothetical protein
VPPVLRPIEAGHDPSDVSDLPAPPRPHDGDRATGVVEDLMADRTQGEASEAAEPAGPHHEKVGVSRRFHQRPGREVTDGAKSDFGGTLAQSLARYARQGL